MCDKDTTKYEYSLAQRCAAEALGVGIIVKGGCGAVCAARYVTPAHPISPLGIASLFGASVTAAVYATRDVSGAHLNPAVTASFAVFRPDACPMRDVVPYWGAQLFGAFVAAGLNYMLYSPAIRATEIREGVTRGAKGSWTSYVGAFGLVPNKGLLGVRGAMVGETAMTAALLFIIFGFTDQEKSVPEDIAPCLIGMSVTVLAAQYGAVTGCGMNPARDLGPRLVTALTGWKKAAWSPGWYVYTAGPMVGGLIGAAAYTSLFTGRAVAKES